MLVQGFVLVVSWHCRSIMLHDGIKKFIGMVWFSSVVKQYQETEEPRSVGGCQINNINMCTTITQPWHNNVNISFHSFSLTSDTAQTLSWSLEFVIFKKSRTRHHSKIESYLLKPVEWCVISGLCAIGLKASISYILLPR